jgi:hypothetical protein
VVKETIQELEDIDAELSGENSALSNFWEEFCVQVQDEHSVSWHAYEQSVQALVDGCVDQLERHELEAAWLQTPEGEEWSLECVDERGRNPANVQDVERYITKERMISAANDYQSPNLREYLNRCDSVDELPEDEQEDSRRIGLIADDFIRFATEALMDGDRLLLSELQKGLENRLGYWGFNILSRDEDELRESVECLMEMTNSCCINDEEILDFMLMCSDGKKEWAYGRIVSLEDWDGSTIFPTRLRTGENDYGASTS